MFHTINSSYGVLVSIGMKYGITVHCYAASSAFAREKVSQRYIRCSGWLFQTSEWGVRWVEEAGCCRTAICRVWVVATWLMIEMGKITSAREIPRLNDSSMETTKALYLCLLITEPFILLTESDTTEAGDKSILSMSHRTTAHIFAGSWAP